LALFLDAFASPNRRKAVHPREGNQGATPTSQAGRPRPRPPKNYTSTYNLHFWELMIGHRECKAMGFSFDSRWVPPVGGAPGRRTSTGGAATGVQSPVLGTRESGGAPSGSQAKSSGAANPQQAARQPDEAMSSGASGWASSQPRRCAGRQAGAHRRGEEEAPMGFQRPTASKSIAASYGYFLWVLSETQEDRAKCLDFREGALLISARV
jgi:hypothetical protein